MQLSPKQEEFFKEAVDRATGIRGWNWPSPLEIDKVYRGEKELNSYNRAINFIIKKDGSGSFYMDYFYKSGDYSHHARVYDSGKEEQLETYEPKWGYGITGDAEKDKAAIKNFLYPNAGVEQLLISKGLEVPSPFTASLLPDDEEFFVKQINTITGIDCWAWPSPLKFGKVYSFKVYTAGSRGLNDFRFVINIDKDGVLYMDHLLHTDDYSSHNRLLRTGESVRLENYQGQYGRTITGDEATDKHNHQQMIRTNEEVREILKRKGLEW